MEITAYTLNAFTNSPKGGNPAGVVLNSDGLTRRQMLQIAKKIGYSETAFIQKSDIANFHISFFTPNNEVDLCGHATIASFSLLSQKRLIKTGMYTQETKAGILNIETKNNGTIFMEQPLPHFFEMPDKKEIAASLNSPLDVIEPNLPAQIVSTGLKDLIVPIKKLADLEAIKPNYKYITELSKKYKIVGYHLFSCETLLNNTFHCRNFAPLLGIPEESATGTANGALACYLSKYGKIHLSRKNRLIFKQGYFMEKPSQIDVNLSLQEQKVTQVKVGGMASHAKKIKIHI